MKWEPKTLDYEKSPCTGLTRDSWLEAAEYYKYQVLRSCTRLCPLYNAAGEDESYLISQVITKESLEDFTGEELFPIARIEYTDPEGCGGYGPVEVLLKSGGCRSVCFEGIEGKMML